VLLSVMTRRASAVSAFTSEHHSPGDKAQQKSCAWNHGSMNDRAGAQAGLSVVIPEAELFRGRAVIHGHNWSFAAT